MLCNKALNLPTMEKQMAVAADMRITAGLFGHEMGLPIHRFIAANNANDIFYEYLQTGKYNPQPDTVPVKTPF